MTKNENSHQFLQTSLRIKMHMTFHVLTYFTGFSQKCTSLYESAIFLDAVMILQAFSKVFSSDISSAIKIKDGQTLFNEIK